VLQYMQIIWSIYRWVFIFWTNCRSKN